MLFAAKHYGAGARLGIRAALALGHAIRIAVFPPLALFHGSARNRVARRDRRAAGRPRSLQRRLSGPTPTMADDADLHDLVTASGLCRTVR